MIKIFDFEWCSNLLFSPFLQNLLDLSIIKVVNPTTHGTIGVFILKAEPFFPFTIPSIRNGWSSERESDKAYS